MTFYLVSNLIFEQCDNKTIHRLNCYTARKLTLLCAPKQHPGTIYLQMICAIYFTIHSLQVSQDKK